MAGNIFVKIDWWKASTQKQITPLSAQFVGKQKRNRKFGAQASIIMPLVIVEPKCRKNATNNECCEKIKNAVKILRLIFCTFLEVGQPIPNMENIFFNRKDSSKPCICIQSIMKLLLFSVYF
jgi:hypothetical protein